MSIRLNAFGHGRAHWAPMYSMPRMEKTSTALKEGSAIAMTMRRADANELCSKRYEDNNLQWRALS